MKTKTAAHRHQHHRHGEERPRPVVAPMSETAVYFMAFLIGGFGILIMCLITDAQYWPHWTLAFFAVLLWIVNLAGWSIYLARPVAGWRQSLGKLPLMTVGYGTRGGKGLEAARGRPEVRGAMIATSIISLLALAGLAYLLMRGV